MGSNRSGSRWSVMVTVICLGLSLFSHDAQSARTADGAFVIRNVRVFDGEKIIPANAVTVVNGRIAAVGVDLKPPPGAEVINGTGDTLLPGLINSHVHLWTQYPLRSSLVLGTTTELDMYMRWEEAQEWKKHDPTGVFADFRTAGTCFVVAGGHATGPPFPPNTPIRSPDQAQAFVSERIAQGSDYIKVMYEDGPREAAMPKPVLAAIVKAAHARGKMVVVHVSSPQAILDALDTGVDGLAHMPIYKMPEPQFRNAIRTHHFFVITTLGYMDFTFGGAGRLFAQAPKDPKLAPYIGPLVRRQLEVPVRVVPEHIDYADSEENLRILRDTGVPILAGTDSAGNTQVGAELHEELELMVKAGLTPRDALADTTSVPAREFGLSDRGRIAPGLRADLVLVRGDPTVEIRKTRDIVAIWQEGSRVDRDAFRQDVAQRNAAWSFGAGWIPVASDPSIVRVEASEDGNRVGRTILLTGEVKPANRFLFAGVEYSPSLQYLGASDDISGTSGMSFRTRGDGKTYTVSLFDEKGIATTKYFVAGKDWSEVAFSFSDFGSDGKRVARVQIASSILGPFHLEVADARIGAHRWLGIELDNDPKVAKITAVNEDSPGQKAGLRAGDVITAFNRKNVKSYQDVLSLLAKTHVGDKVPIEIERDGERRNVLLGVGQRQS